jgi:hypothetical protein
MGEAGEGEQEGGGAAADAAAAQPGAPSENTAAVNDAEAAAPASLLQASNFFWGEGRGLLGLPWLDARD